MNFVNILIFYLCFNTMQTEIIHKKINETHRVVLSSRGASGLQMMYRVDHEGLVSVERINNLSGEKNMPGNSIEVVFEIRAQIKGSVKIVFYETQPWNKDFKEIVLKEIMLSID